MVPNTCIYTVHAPGMAGAQQGLLFYQGTRSFSRNGNAGTENQTKRLPFNMPFVPAIPIRRVRGVSRPGAGLRCSFHRFHELTTDRAARPRRTGGGKKKVNGAQ